MALPGFCNGLDSYHAHLTRQCEALQVTAPDPLAIENSFYLCQKIVQKIAQEDAISFQDFMQMALYEQGLGYYSSGQQKFGSGGDFVTAPEISPFFAQTFAHQFTQVFEDVEANILELGAGTGIFAVDCLLELESLNQLPEKYFILEVSAELQARQKETIELKVPHLINRVQWLNDLPINYNGVVFANEVADAIPCHLYRKHNNSIEEAQVNFDDKGFKWFWKPIEKELSIDEKSCNEWPNDYLFEVREIAAPWVESLLETMHQGVIFLVDYGYSEKELYSKNRLQGSLQGYYQHHKLDNPLSLVGLQDLTSSVDFTQLALAADKQKAQLLGFNTQSMFLIGAGIESLACRKMESAAIEQEAIENGDSSDTMRNLKYGQQLKTLLMPEEMGESCKVLAIGKNYSQANSQPLKGFSLDNQLHKL